MWWWGVIPKDTCRDAVPEKQMSCYSPDPNREVGQAGPSVSAWGQVKGCFSPGRLGTLPLARISSLKLFLSYMETKISWHSKNKLSARDHHTSYDQY